MEQLILSRSVLLEDTANVIACGETTSCDVGVGHGAAFAHEVIEKLDDVERLRAFGWFGQCWSSAFSLEPVFTFGWTTPSFHYLFLCFSKWHVLETPSVRLLRVCVKATMWLQSAVAIAYNVKGKRRGVVAARGK